MCCLLMKSNPGPAPRTQAPPPGDIQRYNANQSIAEINVASVVPVKKAKKRPLMDIIRENQEAYNTFIRKIICQKFYRQLQIPQTTILIRK